ncbi:MAG: methylenetetrahydrofolate reductase [NAD(P)H] [Clostridium sp.]|nr:methylenetetrahydrofolate reductase [NAD(P)H] [Clostridium sp.]
MKIKDMYSNKKPVISFEIFPPKKDGSLQSIYNTIDVLSALNPDFISVTYGAAGSTDSKTTEIASIIKNKYNIEALAHLTCITSSKENIDKTLNNLKSNNVNNVLALRGDIPADFDKNFASSYKHASDLIKHIKSQNTFSIGAACYPEGHVESKSIDEDLANLKLKVANGAEFLITQLFFDNDRYYDFKDKLISMNINTPISVGIMPVINKKQIIKIASLSGAYLPSKFKRLLDKYEYKPEVLKEAAIAYATEQIIDLISSGADGIHIYTMNKPEIAQSIVKNISNIRES